MANTQMLQQQYGQYQEQLGQYGQELNKFNMAADVYNRQAKEYQALVDAYKALPGYQAYEKATADYNAAVPAYNQQVEKIKPQIEAYNQKVNFWSGGNIKSNYVYLVGNVSGSPQSVINKLAQPAAYGNNAARLEIERIKNTYAPGTAPTLPAALVQPVNTVADKAPGEFTAAKPELTAVAPKDPGFTGQQMKQIQGQQTLAQQEKAGENETGLIQRVQGQKQKPDSLIGGMLQNVRYST